MSLCKTGKILLLLVIDALLDAILDVINPPHEKQSEKASSGGGQGTLVGYRGPSCGGIGIVSLWREESVIFS